MAHIDITEKEFLHNTEKYYELSKQGVHITVCNGKSSTITLSPVEKNSQHTTESWIEYEDLKRSSLYMYDRLEDGK